MTETDSDQSIEDLRLEIALLSAERDAYQQELFETERHSAWLSIERQKLVDRCHELEGLCRKIEASFVQSTSWRVSAPLRALSRLRSKS